MSSTVPTFNQVKPAVQYVDRLCKTNRDGTPNKSAPSRNSLVTGKKIDKKLCLQLKIKTLNFV